MNSSEEKLINQAYSNLKERIIRREVKDEITGDIPTELKEKEDRNLPGYFYDYENILKNNNKSEKIIKHLENIQDLTNRDNRYDRLVKAAEHPEIDGGLKIHADEAITKNPKDEIYNIYHNDNKIKIIIRKLFDRIGLEDLAWQSIYNFCLLGDEFREIIYSLDGRRIQRINYIPPKLITRIERNGVLQYFEPREPSTQYSDLNNLGGNYYWDYLKMKENNSKEVSKLEPFRILHSRIPSFKYSPYGESIIEKQVPVIEKLVLLEQSMLIARLTRSPERRIYNVAVGQMQGEKAMREAAQVVEKLKRKRILDMFNGSKVDKTVDFWGAVEDIVIPRRTGEEPSTVDTLPGINNTSENGDVEFIRDRIFPGFVPRQYIYDDQFANANQNLSNKDVHFAKKIRRIQGFHLQSVYKLAVIELALAGYSKNEIAGLTITMNNPSNLDEKERLEVQNSIWGLVSSVKGVNSEETPFFPDYLIYRDILNFSNEEALLVQKLNLYQKDKKNPFYLIPKEDRPYGYEELDSLLNPEVPETTADVNVGDEEDDNFQFDDETSDDTEGAFPSEVSGALDSIGGERGELEMASSLNSIHDNKNIMYNETLKKRKKALILKKKVLEKNRKRLEKELKEKNLILESENIEEISEEEIILRIREKSKMSKETVLNLNLEYFESFGELTGIQIKE